MKPEDEEDQVERLRIEHLDWHDGGGWSVLEWRATRTRWRRMVRTLEGVLDMSFRLVTENGEVVEQWDSPREIPESILPAMMAKVMKEGETVPSEADAVRVIAEFFQTEEGRRTSSVGEWFRDESGVLFYGVFRAEGLIEKTRQEYDPEG